MTQPHFFACVYLIFDCLEQIRLLFLFVWLYCAWEIFDSHSLPRVELVGVLGDDTRQINATDKAVMNDKPLRSVLARSLNRKDLNFVDQFLKHNGSQRLHRHKLSYCSDEITR